MTDWGQAGFIGGVGFGTVLVVLIVLALVVWLAGIIINRTHRGGEKPESK
ncbi:MAG: OadG family transporter subunit [Dehalococcoidia bacterium]|nr:OadG family transporter subunit [Dehalococcoidia bacterium]